jgi:hypothetical protein
VEEYGDVGEAVQIADHFLKKIAAGYS